MVLLDGFHHWIAFQMLEITDGVLASLPYRSVSYHDLRRGRYSETWSDQARQSWEHVYFDCLQRLVFVYFLKTLVSYAGELALQYGVNIVDVMFTDIGENKISTGYLPDPTR